MNKHILNLAGELARALIAEQDLNWRCVYCSDALKLLIDAMDDTVAITALQEAEYLIREDAFNNLDGDETARSIRHQEAMERLRKIDIQQIDSYLLRPQAF